MKKTDKLGFAAIVLAAGQGKRMKSDVSKVLHQVAGKPIIQRTFEMLTKVNPEQIIIVANPNNANEVKKVTNGAGIAIQKEPLGTADATRTGLESIKEKIKTVAVMYGDDSAFYKPKTVQKVFQKHTESNATVTFVTLIKENPAGLGRIIRKNNKLIAIVEEKDAAETEKKIKEVNDGLYFFKKNWLEKNIVNLKPSPATGELYLTDLIEIALASQEKVETYLLKDERQWHGINTPQELITANLKFLKNIHFMGIAGSGISAVAQIAKEQGFQITGCDLNPQSEYVKSLKIQIKKGHDSKHLKNINLLIISPAVLKYDPQNPELKSARKLNIPIITWQQFQGDYLQKDKFTIAVSGAYGKSTTTAMVSQIMVDQNLDPTCEIGAKILAWQSNYKVGKSKYYVCEADEYNNNFLFYNPDIAVILDISWDHPDFFKSEEEVTASYHQFISQIKKNGYLITTNEVLKKLGAIRGDIKTIIIKNFGQITLDIVGDFRKENANAALTIAETLGLDINSAKKALSNFKGLGRRLEYKGKVGKTEFWDDYAVQPYTIQKTANALREKFPNKKILLVLEPHTFSRIEKFFGQFVSSLKNTGVDKIYITSIYAARENSNSNQILSEKLTKSIGKKAIFTGSLDKTAKKVKSDLSEYDLILTMGAGDIYKLYDIVKNG